MPSESPKLTFIIPAKNEEKTILETLISIEKYCNISHEIIVVDHNSTDKTKIVAEQFGATVILKVGGTISSVRNVGAKVARGNILVFLDADVSLTEAWKTRMPDVLAMLDKNPLLLTGSHCTAPIDDGWLSKYWFSRFSQSETTVHIGSGHLIMSKHLFEKLRGFDEAITTGEDYDICSRAKQLGSEIVNDKALKVVHRDYPQTIIGLIKRESWHGVGDTWPPIKIIRSKVAIATIVFISLHMLLIAIFFVYGLNSSYIILPLTLIFCITLLSSALKFRHNGYKLVLLNSVLFYFYYIGRSTSFLRKIIK